MSIEPAKPIADISDSFAVGRSSAASSFQTADTPRPAEAVPSTSPSIARILLVDDEATTRTSLSYHLAQAGYEIETVENGFLAVEAVQAAKPDLVLTDISMPKMDGYQSLRMMRQIYDAVELPVVVMTSDSTDLQIVRCFNAGANDYLTKPIRKPTMLARIDMQLQLRNALLAVRESEQRYALASQGTRDGIWDWNLSTNEIYLSPRWLAMVGVEDPNWVPSVASWMDLVFHEDRKRVQADLEAHLCGETSHFETELRMPDQTGGFRWMLCRGVAVRDANNIPTRIAGSLTDITEGKVADALTHLPNRTLFRDRIERCVQQFKRNPIRRFAVLYIDVNDFKLVNDSLGHDVGDEFLIKISKRLNSGLRQSDSVLARLGGDEFGILIEGVDGLDDAIEVADRVQQRMKAPFGIAGREILARISIGVAVVSESNASTELILRQSDTAMYHAKRAATSGVAAFEDRMHQESSARLEISSELKHAIRRDELKLVYQPIVDAASFQTAGFEALLRWNHPVHGNISPIDFIPIAEDNGMIVEIGDWVLGQACQQAAVWNQQSGREVIISVNASIRQFSGDGFVDQVRNAIAESGIRPHQLKLEVTESLLMQHPDETIEVLRQLDEMGVTTSIDDFGTGYSSLAYLHQMPLRVLKIDRSFVTNLTESSKHQAIVRSIIALARSLNLKVIAEGIETSSQAAYLGGLACEYFQGFLFSRPVEDQQTIQLLEHDWSSKLND